MALAAGPAAVPAGALEYPAGFELEPVPDPLASENPVHSLLPASVPDVGEAFFDARFGTLLTRVTTIDGASGRHEYSRFDPFNSDGSRIVLLHPDGMAVYRTASMPYNHPANLVRTLDIAEPRWDRSDPRMLWGFRGFQIVTLDVTSGQITIVKDFASDPLAGPIIASQPVYRITCKDEGESSYDRRYWGLMLQGDERVDYQPLYLLSWDRQQDRVLGTYALGPDERDLDWVGMSWLGNWVLIGGMESLSGNIVGLTMADRTFQTFHRLDWSTAHADIGLDSRGREVVVMQNVRTDHIDLIPVELATKPILEAGGSYAGTNRTPLVRLYYASDSPHGLQSGVHISCNVPGYAVVSTTTEPGVPEQNWLDRSVTLVRLDASAPRMSYLAKLHGTTGAYWEETHASIREDGSKLVWATNWGQDAGQERVFLMQLDMPPGWNGGRAVPALGWGGGLTFFGALALVRHHLQSWTAHLVLEPIATDLPLPGLHIAEVVCHELAAHGWKRVGWLGTTIVQRQGGQTKRNTEARAVQGRRRGLVPPRTRGPSRRQQPRGERPERSEGARADSKRPRKRTRGEGHGSSASGGSPSASGVTAGRPRAQPQGRGDEAPAAAFEPAVLVLPANAGRPGAHRPALRLAQRGGGCASVLFFLTTVSAGGAERWGQAPRRAGGAPRKTRCSAAAEGLRPSCSRLAA